MIRHRIFSKGETIYALISNNRYSNIVFPIKAIIHDVEFDEKMPRYQVRILKMYDDIDFIKRFMFDMRFDKNFNGGVTVFKSNRTQFKTIGQFQEYLDKNWETHLIVIDSVMCTKRLNELTELYNKIQDFLIEKAIRDLYELANRKSYTTGQYYYKSKGVFEAHIKKFLGDRAKDEKGYFEKLLFRPTSIDYDNLES